MNDVLRIFLDTTLTHSNMPPQNSRGLSPDILECTTNPTTTYKCADSISLACRQPSDHHFLLALYEFERDRRVKELADREQYENELEDGIRETVDWVFRKLEADFHARILRGK